MSNTRFALASANQTLVAGNKLINGAAGYTNNPGFSHDAQYKMANLLDADRYSKWRSGVATPAPMLVDFDFLSAKDIGTMAVHGLRLPSGGTGPTQVIFKYQVSAYDGTGSWSTKETVSLAGAPRDAGVVSASVTSARYWRAEFTAPSDGFSVGVIYFGDLPIDLGVLYSAGAGDAILHNRLRTNTPMGAPVINDMGDEGRALRLPYDSITTAKKDQLITVARASDAVTYFSPFDEVMQVLINGSEKHESNHEWSPGELWNATLDLTRLP